MAMNGKVLGDAIANAILHPDATQQARQGVYEVWEKIGEQIVSHIINNIQIQINIPSASVVVAASGGTPNPAEIGCLQKSVS